MTLSPELVDAIGALGACLTTLCWVPQAVRIIRTKDTRAISLLGTSTFTFGVGLWLAYGVARSDGPVIGANAVTLALMLVIIGLKLRHG